ncbi:2-keto-4-pentenoate hydratase [Tritonibacter scottomollicae]|uniref:2-oxo-hept-3-ene-1,7-dioate hydratase n=1 Tax=Tritonibacter scottomollicae TaxID=483013 RepID=A0A2T1ADJ6_TRISK|nr:hydratase [Tritonibacter scottomollicae]PRZ46651.1 2-oxo-hept-3-ene-1,7-dioate hydratase [Tritonibacter scottomollicae]
MQQVGHWIWALIAAGVIGAGSAAADCASDEEVARFVADYMDHRPTEALGQGGTMVDALCTQARLSDALAAHLGPVIGYKAGLTSTPAQERFGASAPVRGVLYRDMMLESGATLDVPWGAVPMVEADLVLEIGDSAVNSATTREEVMQNISSIRPFIELPDLAVDQSQPMTPETITAMGVGARHGVLGAAIPVADAAAMTKALAEMQVQLRDGAGEVVLSAPGTSVLGHPAETILWLHAVGVTFKAGDLVSVGSFGPLVPPGSLKGGATVSYEGLPGSPEVSVLFGPSS